MEHEGLTLDSVNKLLESLENEENYILDRISNILGLVLPQGKTVDSLRVDGGKKIDKILKYTNIKEELLLDERLKYVQDKIKDLKVWKEKEIKRLNKYDDLIKLVVYFKEEVFIKDKRNGKLRHLTWDEIATNCYCSEKTARNKYHLAIESRKVEER